jgi:uroporphyrinogen-III synthase
VVDDVVAYRTVATLADDPKLARGLAQLRAGAPVCAVFAPSQVHALAALVELAGLTCSFAAIGATTASALANAGIAGVAVATQPTPDGIAAAVATVYPRR